VKPNVARTTTAVRQSRRRSRNSSVSAMFQETTTNTPARAASGMKLANGAATSDEYQ
jgi:hypothetical protein